MHMLDNNESAEPEPQNYAMRS